MGAGINERAFKLWSNPAPIIGERANCRSTPYGDPELRTEILIETNECKVGERIARGSLIICDLEAIFAYYGITMMQQIVL